MKIRIKGNSIRYRLTKSEVEIFCKTGRFEETTNFGGTIFTYAVEAKENIDILDAQFDGSTITLFLEKEKSKRWYTSKKVGYSHKITQADGSELSMLLEKDFVCLDERGEDESDNYANPKLL